MSENPTVQESATPEVEIARLKALLDAAESRFVKARDENSEQEQEISDLTNELVVTREKLNILQRTQVKPDELVTYFWRGVWTGAITCAIVGLAAGFSLGVCWAYFCQ